MANQFNILLLSSGASGPGRYSSDLAGLTMNALGRHGHIVEHRRLTQPVSTDGLLRAVERNDFLVVVIEELSRYKSDFDLLERLLQQVSKDRVIISGAARDESIFRALQPYTFAIDPLEFSTAWDAEKLDDLALRMGRHFRSVGPLINDENRIDSLDVAPYDRPSGKVLSAVIFSRQYPALVGAAAIAALAVIVIEFLNISLHYSSDKFLTSLAFALIAALIFVGILRITLPGNQSRREYERPLPEIEDQVIEIKSRITDLREQFGSFSSAIAKSLVTELDRVLTGRLDRAISRDPPVREVNASDKTSAKAIIQELNHSMQTPLSQISVAVHLLLDADFINPDSEDAASLRRIKNSVKMCQSFLGAFKEITTTQVADAASSGKLIDHFQAAHELYCMRANVSANLKVNNTPDRLPGYSTDYIVSVVMPLLENAVEASTDGTPIEITYQNIDNGHRISVKSKPGHLPSGNEIYQDGFSTKPSEHQGLGLSTVKRLLADHKGSSLGHIYEDKHVIFSLMLPEREE